MVRKFTLVAIMAITLIFTVVAAEAGQNFINELASSKGIEAGPVKLHVGAKLELQHDTNIYTAAANEKDDNVSIVMPAAALTMKIGESNLKLGASADMYKFSDNSKEDNTATHAVASYSVKTPAGFEFSLSDTYSDIEDVHPDQHAPKRAKHKDNTLSTNIGFQLPSEKVKVTLGYSALKLDYADKADEFQNKEEKKLNVTVFYKMLAKTRALVEIENKTIEYPDFTANRASDSTEKTVYVGLKWDPTAKLSGHFKVGFAKKEFDNAKVKRGAAVYNSDDDDYLSVGSQFTYTVSSATKVRFRVVRRMSETTYAGNAARNLSASTHYKMNQIGFGFDQKVMDKIALTCDYSIQNDYYNALDIAKLKRSDTKHSLVVTGDYAMNQRMKVGGKFDYSTKDSDDPGNEERRTIASVHLKLMI